MTTHALGQQAGSRQTLCICSSKRQMDVKLRHGVGFDEIN